MDFGTFINRVKLNTVNEVKIIDVETTSIIIIYFLNKSS